MSSSHGYYCCVPVCQNRSVNDPSLSFHCFPNDRTRKDVRKAWIVAIRRDEGRNFKVTSNTKVCSAHFAPEDFKKSAYTTLPGHSRRILLPTAVPSIFSWPQVVASKRRTLQRDDPPPPKRRRSRRDVSDVDGQAPLDFPADPTTKETTGCPVADPPDPVQVIRREHDYCATLPDGSDLPPEVLDHIRSLEKRVNTLETQVRDLKSRLTTVENLKGNDADFSAATGLPNYAVFKAFLKILSPKAKRMTWWRGKTTIRRFCHAGRRRLYNGYARRLSIEEQFFAVLVRLRTAVSVRELSRQLKITQSSFSIMFTTWIIFLYYELEALNKATTTKCATRGDAAFKYFPNTRVVVDCTEVFTERPSGLKARKQLFSNYKHHSTIKFLVGSSPNGSINYVSKVWGGRSSDKKITCDASGCLDLLQPGEAVMADRGFLIEEEVAARGCKLHMPAFLTANRAQLTAAEVTQTRRIARARIHVERAIQRIKLFRILKWLPLTLLHVSEQIFKVCAFLTNYQKPVIADIVDL